MLHMSKNNIDQLAHKTEATLRPVAAIIVTYKFEREGRVQLVLSFIIGAALGTKGIKIISYA